ncbi:MAG TPA: Rieske 2Fe-2S domain-containing protein [Mycobacterium sp.]|jgi:toluene monooxygenase system ferredoxin subunit|nr:Rieske 2Fe-2S domain-containing protein [Mycobacterium sp.]
MATSSPSTKADFPIVVWQYAGTLDDIWEGEMCAAKLGTVDVLLCNVDGQLVAYQDQCPHLANPLSAGVLSDNVITCAAHEWSFDARSGRGVNPETSCLRRYPVRVDGERIFVDVGPDP